MAEPERVGVALPGKASRWCVGMAKGVRVAASVRQARRWWCAYGGREGGWRLPAVTAGSRLGHPASLYLLDPWSPSMLAMIRTAPPQRAHVSISIWNTRLRRWAQVMAAWRSAAVLGEPGWRRGPRRAGVTCTRRLWLGANTPWNRVRLTRGVGTKAASRAMKSSGQDDPVYRQRRVVRGRDRRGLSPRKTNAAPLPSTRPSRRCQPISAPFTTRSTSSSIAPRRSYAKSPRNPYWTRLPKFTAVNSG